MSATMNKAWGTAALLAALACLGLKCNALFPDTSTPGRKVLKVADSGALEVERPDGEGSQMIWFQGFSPRSYTGVDVKDELKKTLNDMLAGKRVHLEFDQPYHPWYTDRNEVLAYVFLDGKLVNAELLRRGLGQYDDTWNPLRYQQQLSGAQEEARQEKRGVWDESARPAPAPRPAPRSPERDPGIRDHSDRRAGRGANVYERQYEDEYGNEARDY